MPHLYPRGYHLVFDVFIFHAPRPALAAAHIAPPELLPPRPRAAPPGGEGHAAAPSPAGSTQPRGSVDLCGPGRVGKQQQARQQQQEQHQQQLGNLATWQLGNLATWQLGNLATWRLGNLATWQLGNLATTGLARFLPKPWWGPREGPSPAGAVRAVRSRVRPPAHLSRDVFPRHFVTETPGNRARDISRFFSKR